MAPRETIERLARTGAAEASLLKAVLDQLPVAVVIAEAPSGRMIALSRHARELLGDAVSADRLQVLRPDGSVVPPGSGPLARTARDGATIRNELYEAIWPDGTRRLLSVSTTPVRGGDGEPVAAVAVFDDVTERTRHLRAEREFIANAAHELRTPLASIASAIEVLQAGAKDEPERDLFLAHIERETQRLARLGRALLIVARAQTRAERPRLEVVPLRPLLTEIAAGTRPGEQVKLTVRCPRSLAALTNRDVVEQAVVNLALNAARYTQTGSIAIIGRDGGDTAVIEIRDTGTGMTDAERSHVFDRFFRGVEPGDGFGLGLSIARQAVEAVDGTLELESAAGRGTTARIRLQLARLVDA